MESEPMPDSVNPADVLRLTPEQVAADPILRAIAFALDSIYTGRGNLDEWIEGSDHQPVALRSLIADLIDADHTLIPDPNDPENDGIWLIDRPWLHRPPALYDDDPLPFDLPDPAKAIGSPIPAKPGDRGTHVRTAGAPGVVDA